MREDEAIRGSKEKNKQRRQTAAYNDTGVLSPDFDTRFYPKLLVTDF